jgi:hypothetical protein
VKNANYKPRAIAIVKSLTSHPVDSRHFVDS